MTASKELAVHEGEFRVVRPLVSKDQALAAWNEYQELTRAILNPSDFQTFNEGGRSGRFIKKSGWRKLATHYGISIELVDERLGHAHDEAHCARVRFKDAMPDVKDCGCPIVFARYVVRAKAPNGRVAEGIGICAADEKNRRFTRQAHDIATTAYTRAVNRAVSDMIGTGEVSAEEARATGDARGLAQEDRDAIRDAWAAASGERRNEAMVQLRAWGHAGADVRALFTAFNTSGQDEQVAELIDVLRGGELPFDPDRVGEEATP